MTQELKLIKWVVVTDRSEYIVTEAQREAILKADAMGARFIQLDGVDINVAFIKEMYRKVEWFNPRFSALSERDKKYLSADDKKLLENK